MDFVAEIGLNHDGNFDLAYELMRQAKLAGASAVKFQLGWRDRPDEINHIDLDRARQLERWAEYLEIEMFCSIISEDAFELVRGLDLPRYKIASRTVVDRPELCEAILAEGKDTLVSLGFWEGDGWPFGPPDGDRLKYVYCVSSYPTYPWELARLPEVFSKDAFYGYSDHCHGIAGCLTAVARGARYIEKHFTLNKTSQVIRDHILSATPEEFLMLTSLGGEMARLRGQMSADA